MRASASFKAYTSSNSRNDVLSYDFSEWYPKNNNITKALQRHFPNPMSHRAYSEIYFHITWHTKSSVPSIEPNIETKLFKFITHKITEVPGVILHAIGGIEDHIHLAVTLPPNVQPAEWIGRIKGSSSHHINQTAGRKYLEWQRGYGIVSFGEKDLSWVVNYVLHQKQHHKRRTTHDRLERTDEEDD